MDAYYNVYSHHHCCHICKLINKVMLRITNTNGKLIEKIQSGLCDEEFPDDKV